MEKNILKQSSKKLKSQILDRFSVEVDSSTMYLKCTQVFVFVLVPVQVLSWSVLKYLNFYPSSSTLLKCTQSPSPSTVLKCTQVLVLEVYLMPQSKYSLEGPELWIEYCVDDRIYTGIDVS